MRGIKWFSSPMSPGFWVVVAICVAIAFMIKKLDKKNFSDDISLFGIVSIVVFAGIIIAMAAACIEIIIRIICGIEI